jgi:hypothetical protein
MIRREPALWLGLVAASVQMISAFVIPLDERQQALLNAFAAAAAGLITAFLVAEEHLAPALLGFVQAGLALGAGFGLALSPERQSVVMAFMAAAVAMFVRTQVVAVALPRRPHGGD